MPLLMGILITPIPVIFTTRSLRFLARIRANLRNVYTAPHPAPESLESTNIFPYIDS